MASRVFPCSNGALQDKKLSSAEIQDMVRFGAKRIFKSSAATLTEEDIVGIAGSLPLMSGT